MALFADRLGLIDTERAFHIGTSIREVEATGARVIKCNLGEPDSVLPRHIRDEIKHQLDIDNTHYSDPQGIPTLRKAVADQISETRRIEVTPEQVVIFPGVKPGIGLCQQAYTNPGDEVVYPSPGFPIYESFTRFLGAKPVPIPLSEEAGFSLTGAELEPLISERTKLIFLNFPSNPTGGVATPEQLEDLADVILRKAPDDVRILSDEVYEHILFDDKRHHSIVSVPGIRDKTIVISGVSKTYGWTGGRLGWAAFPTVREASAFRNLNINYFSCMPAYNQEGARVAITAPESQTHIQKMATAFQKRRDVVVDGLNAIDGVTCRLPTGAFYVFPNISGLCERIGAIEAYESLPPDVRERTSPSTLVLLFLLFKYHVATLDRRAFGRIGSEGQHYLRMSVATEIEDLREALRRIERAGRDPSGFAAFMAEGRYTY